jgi:hypothetical protein
MDINNEKSIGCKHEIIFNNLSYIMTHYDVSTFHMDMNDVYGQCVHFHSLINVHFLVNIFYH